MNLLRAFWRSPSEVLLLSTGSLLLGASFPREARASAPPVRYALSELQMENTQQARDVAAMRREIDYLLNRLNELPSDLLPVSRVHYIDPSAELRHAAENLVAPTGVHPPPSVGERQHTVRQGETLSSISRVFGIHVRDLQHYNQIADPGKLLSGTLLRIPSPTPRPAAADSSASRTADRESGGPGAMAVVRGAAYTAKKGDTFWRIAKLHQCSREELLQANGLGASAILKEGQQLALPTRRDSGAPAPPDRPQAGAGGGHRTGSAPPPSSSTGYVYYTARPGDTFQAVAARRGISLAQLKADNPSLAHLQALRAGEVLVVPELGYRGGSPTVLKSEPSSTNPAEREQFIAYPVSAGETLADVARSFGTTVTVLHAINDIAPGGQLAEGTLLNVPIPARHQPD